MIRRPGLRAGSHICNLKPLLRRGLATPRTIQSLLFSENAASLKEGDVCRVNGWVRSVRTQKHVAFVALGDGTTLKPLQVVLQPDQADG
jgi:asparaginyl-tRNA synthetase